MLDCLCDGFQNLGIATNGIDPCEQKTIIVTGLARSGTTMLIQMLSQAMPTFSDNTINYEDRELFDLMSQVQASPLIEQRNREYDLWATKNPRFYFIMDSLALFRNPCLLIPIRDPLAIAIRESVARDVSFSEELSTTVDSLKEMIESSSSIRVPLMFVSYEKAIMHPERTAGLIGDWIGESLTADSCEPERAEYQESAREERMKDW